jgi:hypothetical protein
MIASGFSGVGLPCDTHRIWIKKKYGSIRIKYLESISYKT